MSARKSSELDSSGNRKLAAESHERPGAQNSPFREGPPLLDAQTAVGTLRQFGRVGIHELIEVVCVRSLISDLCGPLRTDALLDSRLPFEHFFVGHVGLLETEGGRRVRERHGNRRRADGRIAPFDLNGRQLVSG